MAKLNLSAVGCRADSMGGASVQHLAGCFFRELEERYLFLEENRSIIFYGNWKINTQTGSKTSIPCLKKIPSKGYFVIFIAKLFIQLNSMLAFYSHAEHSQRCLELMG